MKHDVGCVCNADKARGRKSDGNCSEKETSVREEREFLLHLFVRQKFIALSTEDSFFVVDVLREMAVRQN